jgi:hypothetical protein
MQDQDKVGLDVEREPVKVEGVSKEITKLFRKLRVMKWYVDRDGRFEFRRL